MDRGGVTIEDLARMVQKGFEDTAKKIDMDARFDVVEKRLDRIEKFLLEEHRRRIERLEGDVRILKDALNIK